MKAAIIAAPGSIEQVELPDPVSKPREVIVSVDGCGICGTDLHILNGEFAPRYPIVPGHEFAGEIVEVGAQVTELRVGDKVTVDPSLHCGECYYCRRGRGNLCENWNALGVSKPGGAAEFTAAPAANCVRLTGATSVADASLVEPLSCAVRGFDVLPRRLGDHYLIYGCGTMGLMMLALAKQSGAGSVSMTDVNPQRLETARLLGCDAATLDVDGLEAPRGWDVVVDCTGVASAISDGLSRVGKGGTFLQFGVTNHDTRVEIEPYKIYNQEITVTGSMAVLHSFERAAQLFAAGVIDPAIFISHRYPLSRYAEAMDQFRAGVGRKVQITKGV